METVDFIREKAVKMYPTLDPSHKTLLEDLFGKKAFQKITDRIKTFEDACEALNIDSTSRKFHDGQPDDCAYQRLKVIVRALNEGWTPDWNKSNEYKWAPWFYMNKPGFRFVDSYSVYTSTDTAGGSRLCFRTRELSDYAGQHFLEQYRLFLCL